VSNYKNDYEAAVKKLVAVKRKGKPPSEAEPKLAKTKVVNIMDALRRSWAEGKSLERQGKRRPLKERLPK
jgi:non-homologous end joining protein Ku